MTVYLANVGDDWEVFETGDLAVAWLEQQEQIHRMKGWPFRSTGLYAKTLHQTDAEPLQLAYIRQGLTS